MDDKAQEHGSSPVGLIRPTADSPSARAAKDAESLRSGTKTVVDDVNETEDVEADAGTESKDEDVYTVFSLSMRRFIVVMASLSALFSPMSSFIYLPAIDTLSKYYGESIARINLSITTFQILQGLAPMFFGSAADQVGRRPVYVATFTIYLCANLGLALQNSYGALMVLRALQSAGSSPTIALSNAVVADIASPAERAGWMGYANAGIMLGPALAPTIGGLLTQFVGWRWIFWFLFIINGVYLLVYIVINPETCRNVVDDGSIPPPKLNRSILDLVQNAKRKAKGIPDPMLSEGKRKRAAQLAAKRGKFRFPNPIASLKCIKEPDVALVMFYQAIMIAAFYAIMVPITPVFSQTYGFNQLQVGLCYIPFAAGAAFGSTGFGKLLNWNFARTARKLGIKADRKSAVKLREFPIERARLQFIFYPNALAAAGLLCWGWVLEQKPNLAAPLIVMAFTAVGSTGSSVMVNTLLVDLYPQSPATVIAANNLVRCMCSAASSAIIQYMIDSMGLGWCYTLIAAIVLLGTSTLVASMKYGPRWREKRTIRMEEKEAKEKAEEQAIEEKIERRIEQKS